MDQERDCSAILLYLYREFKSKSHNGCYIEYGIVKEIINRRLYHFPKQIRWEILREMESKGLIKKSGNTSSIRYTLVANNVDKILNKIGIPIID